MVFIFLVAVIALLIIYLEFYLPGGIMATIGALMALGAIAASIYLNPSIGIPLAIFELIAVIFTISLAYKHVNKKLKLSMTQEGYLGCYFDETLIGKYALVVKDLRPSGFIEVEGTTYQALSEGEYIKKNTLVKIIGGHGAHLIVR